MVIASSAEPVPLPIQGAEHVTTSDRFLDLDELPRRCCSPASATSRSSLRSSSTDKAAREYLNDPRGVHFVRGRLTVSKIDGWFEEDFGGSAAGVLAHLWRYGAPPLAARLARRSAIDDYAYD